MAQVRLLVPRDRKAMQLRVRHRGRVVAQVEGALLLEHGDAIDIRHQNSTERFEVMDRRLVIDAQGPVQTIARLDLDVERIE